jgi:hypothetical protein
VLFWFIVPRFGIFTEKNLATLMHRQARAMTFQTQVDIFTALCSQEKIF